jgi:hypothetical protein
MSTPEGYRYSDLVNQPHKVPAIRCGIIIAGEWGIFGGKTPPSRDDTTSDLCCDDIKTVAFQSGQLIRLLIEEIQAGFVILSSMI